MLGARLDCVSLDVVNARGGNAQTWISLDQDTLVTSDAATSAEDTFPCSSGQVSHKLTVAII